MSRDRAYDKILKEWATKWKLENLSDKVRTLINQTNFDLYYGPINDGAVGDPAEEDESLKKYPGFSEACDIITKALKDLPSELYLDVDTGEVLEREPEGEECEDCGGDGKITNDEGETITCDGCNGQGGFEACDDWSHVERREIRNAVVGKELSGYVW